MKISPFRLLWFSVLVGCEPAKVVFDDIAILDTGALNTTVDESQDQSEEPSGEPASEPSTNPEPSSDPIEPEADTPSEPSSEPAEEPVEEPSGEPAEEPASEPASEPSQEEPLPPVDFSDFVEDGLGLERGVSGLDSMEGDLVLWLDASLTSTVILDSDGAVESWQNRSVFSDHAEQTQNSVRPGYDSTEQMIDFNGNHYFMVANQIVDINTTYFVVYKGNDPVGTLFAKANETGIWSQGGKTFFIRDGKYTTDVGWVGYFTATSFVSSSSASIATFEHREDGNADQHLIYHNGILELDATWNYNTFPESQLTDGGVFKIGYTSTDFPQSHGLYGKIGEIIKVDRTLSDTQRMMIHAYLASKWGILSESDSDGDGAFDDVDAIPFDPNSN